ncbi:hypothetical protein ERJ75_001004700 [Trypanosoma vivax]|nr:hypothetical protein ERJ75_001004700 [Trypanosoma vivax]
MEVARRRLETFRWFEKTRSAEEIRSRFALDRRLGVAPCLAAVHRALSRLQQLHRTEAIADLVEDLVMDSSTLSIWTLLQIVEGLKGQPERAARVVFSLASLVTNGTVPTSVWTSLCCELDKVARHMPAPLERSLVELFGEVLYRARDEGPVNGAIVVCYGQALLKSRAPIRSIVGLVQAELLSGRNTPPADAVSEARLGAFLSDLIQVMCASDGGADGREDVLSLTVNERLIYSSDLVKHAYASRLLLAQSALDAFLTLCDEARDYHRLSVVFLAMCMLSTPTLLAITRVAEVLCDMKELSDYLADVLQQSTPSLLLYAVMRHGGSLFPYAKNGSARSGRAANKEKEKLESHFCECAARLCVRDGDESVCMGLFAAFMDMGRPAATKAFVCALAGALKLPVRMFNGHATCASVAAAIEPFNTEVLYYALLPVLSRYSDSAVGGAGGVSPIASNSKVGVVNAGSDSIISMESLRGVLIGRSLGSLFSACGAPERAVGVSIDLALSELLNSPHIYSTIIDETAICDFADNVPLADAFVKMMSGYATSTGALTFVTFEVCASDQLTNAGRQLIVTWLTQHKWFVLLPFSLTAQLFADNAATAPGQSPSDSTEGVRNHSLPIRLFQAIRRLGHARVAFITAPSTIADDARAIGIHPVITTADLSSRLIKT